MQRPIACPGCNLHKADRTTAVDPATGEQVPLFHPIRQRWSEHFRFKGYEMEGWTPVGRATVAMLNLNHVRRQRIREVEEAFGLYPPTRLGYPFLQSQGFWRNIRTVCTKNYAAIGVWNRP